MNESELRSGVYDIYHRADLILTTIEQLNANDYLDLAQANNALREVERRRDNSLLQLLHRFIDADNSRNVYDNKRGTPIAHIDTL